MSFIHLVPYYKHERFFFSAKNSIYLISAQYNNPKQVRVNLRLHYRCLFKPKQGERHSLHFLGRSHFLFKREPTRDIRSDASPIGLRGCPRFLHFPCCI